MATRNPSLNILPALKKAAGQKAAAEADELHGPRGEWWWTGLKPAQCPGFDKKAGVLRWVVEGVTPGHVACVVVEHMLVLLFVP